MSFVFFVLYLAANFVWLLLVVGGLMAWMMSPGKNRNRIIVSVVGALALALTLAVDSRGPDFDDAYNGECETSRMGERCH